MKQTVAFPGQKSVFRSNFHPLKELQVSPGVIYNKLTCVNRKQKKKVLEEFSEQLFYNFP